MKTEPSPLARLARRGAFLSVTIGDKWSAGFGGFSWRALEAYACLVDAWYSADSSNRLVICAALRHLLPAFRPSDHYILKAIIHGLGYEGAIAELWPTLLT